MRDVSLRCIDALLGNAADGSEDVRVQIIASLRSMASKDVVGILRQCQRWLTANKHSSTPHLQRFVVVRAMVEMLRNNVTTTTLDASMRDALIACAFTELTSIMDLTSEWARESCEMMVELCELFPKQGCAALIDPIQSTTLPHFFVMKALAGFATSSPLRFLPFLKEAMSKILPILGLAKQDNHRMIFATALGAFSDAVLQLAARNEELTPRSQNCATLTRTDFSDSMYSAMNFLVGDWSRVSEPRVRGPVMLAIGTSSAVIADENRAGLLPKIVPLMVSAMKREKPKDQVPVSRGFAALFLHCSDDIAAALQPHMETLLQTLVTAIVSTNADRELMTCTAVKTNSNNLMHAAENIAAFWIDGLLTFISKTLDAKSGSKDAAVRAACLTILKHLASRKSLEPQLDPYKDNIIATIKLASGDADWRVRKAIVACVISIGTSSINFFGAIGGTDLLMYLIRNSAIPNSVVMDFNEAAKKKDPCLGTSPEDVRDTCRNTLALFTATSSKLDRTLWPFILEHFTDHVASPDLLLSFPCICRCIVQLGNRVMEQDFYYIDFHVKVNIPRPGHLAAKFLVQAMQFDLYSADELQAILEAMTVIAPLLDEPLACESEEVPTPIGTLWLATVPELQEYVASGQGKPDEWEEIMCKFVSKTMTAKQIETWVEEVTSAAVAHLDGYLRNEAMFRAALLTIGIGVGRCTKRDFIASTTEGIVNAANHDLLQHRMGLAKALGYIAAYHPDVALERLSLLSKGPEKKGFFGGGGRDKGKKELVEQSRAVAAYGLGFACRRMPQQILASRLEASVIPVISTIVTETKVVEVKEATFDAITLLEAALKKQPATFAFKSRDALIDTLLAQVPLAPNPKVPSSPALMTSAKHCMRSVAAVVNAVPNPVLSATVTDKVNAFVLHLVQRGWPDVPADTDTAAQAAAVELLTASFNNNPKLDLDSLLSLYHSQTVLVGDADRRRAMTIYVKMIQAGAKRMERMLANSEAVSGSISPGMYLGRLVPRFMDTVPEIRKLAADGITAASKMVAMMYPEMVSGNEVDVEGILAELKALRSRVTSLVKDGTQASEKEAAAITKQLCGCIVALMPEQEHFAPLLDTLLVAGLTDPQDDAASCSCVVMHGMIRGLGGKLPEAAARKSLEDLVEALDKVRHREQSLNGILVSIRNLAKHHPLMSFNRMLKYETPHPLRVIQSCQTISSDTTLAKNFLLHCLDTILNSQLLEDRPDAKDKRKLVKDLSPAPLAAACAIGWIAQGAPKAVEAATTLRGAVFPTLVLYLTATHEFGDAPKMELVANSLKSMILATAMEVTIDRLERYGWPHLSAPEGFQAFIQEVIKYLCHEELGDTGENDRNLTLDQFEGLPLPPSEPSPLIIEIAEFILPYANKPIASHRRAAVNVAAALLRHSIGEARLVQSICTALLSRSGTDELALIRAEALQGFAALTAHPYNDIISYVSPVLSALLSNFSDPDPRVSLSAMLTLHHIVEKLDNKGQVAPIVVNIILKVKALFECPDAAVRCQSYRILALVLTLANNGLMDEATMDQQTHLHLITLLMHVEDDDPDTRQAAKESLHQAAIFIAHHSHENAKAHLDDLFAKPHVQPTNKLRLDEFANDFCYLWVLNFPGRVNDLLVSAMTFFNSPHESLRGAAVVLCGFMLKHLPSEDFGRANVDQVCQALIQLLSANREKSAMVRMRAARAIGMLREV